MHIQTTTQHNFNNQCAVVTGGAQGIGGAVSSRLAASGARVAIWDIEPDAIAAAEAAMGPSVKGFVVDISDEASVEAGLQATVEWAGPVSILVNSAGIAGPNAPVAEYDTEAWRLIREKIRVEDPTPYGLFLGCKHEIGEITLGRNGPKVRTMTYNVESYLMKSVEAYLELLPQGTRLKRVTTPFLPTSIGPDICAPTKTGPSLVCPYCRGAFHESEFLPPEKAGKKWAKAKSGSTVPASGGGKGSALETDAPEIAPPPRGALADKAASILMQVLYAARYARFDLLCAVARLAQKISKWTVECDLALHRLISYIHSTLEHRLVGYVGDALTEVGVHVYADADFAGDPSTK